MVEINIWLGNLELVYSSTVEVNAKVMQYLFEHYDPLIYNYTIDPVDSYD